MTETADLTIYDRIANPIDAIKMLGNAIAKSRIFGCETPDQGMILAWECLVRRVAPLSLKETYHLISTSNGVALTMRADAMLAGFTHLGGSHRIIQRDGDAAEIELTKASGESQRFRCTYQDAKDAGYMDTKKPGEIKGTYGSPRQAMQMLWARVVSDGVRAMDPRVCAGRYVPEDFGQPSGQEDLPPLPDDGSVVTVETSANKSPTVTKETSKPSTTVKTTAEEPPFVLQEETQKAATTTAAAESEPGTITAVQKAKIEELYEFLGVSPETREKALKSRNCNSLRNLSTEQAGEILAKLEAAKRKAAIAAEAAAVGGESSLPNEATSAALAGPCSAEQVDRAKQLVVELQQSFPGVNISQVIKSKLVASGLNTLADLSMGDMDNLLQQMGTKNLERWVESQLSKPVATKPVQSGN